MPHPDPFRAVPPASAIRRAVAAALNPALFAGPQTLTNPVESRSPAPSDAPHPNAPSHSPSPQNAPKRPISHGPAPAAGGTNPPRATAAPRPLRPRQITAARLLLAGQSFTAVAASLGVTRQTVARWAAEPCFQTELRRQSDAVTKRSVSA